MSLMKYLSFSEILKSSECSGDTWGHLPQLLEIRRVFGIRREITVAPDEHMVWRLKLHFF